jgi:hypothetical protein
MNNDASAWWGKGALVKIKISVEAGIGGKFGLAERGAKEIECDVGLWHQEVPFRDGKFGVACGETGTEMVLPSLDCSFGGVTLVAVRQDELETNVIFFERLFEFLRAFVVKNVEFRGIAMHLELGVEAGPGVGEFASLTGLERLGEDGITAVIVENHHIIITSRRL